MSSFSYDFDALRNIDGLSVKGGIKNFIREQEYFNTLTDFVEGSHGYLQYAPTVVMYSDDVRSSFMEELEAIRGKLMLIGLEGYASGLDDLAAAVTTSNIGALTDRLMRFHIDMENATKQIASARVQESSEAQAGEKPVILAVDDMPEILASITGALEDKYRVICMTNGEMALKALEMYSPVLFLLDIEMPGMDGYELVKKIRETHKHSPVLFLTGNASRDYVESARKYGVKEYILKPVDKNILLKKIERYIK